MPNAILMAVMRLLEAVADFALCGALAAAGAAGLALATRWLVAAASARATPGGGAVAVARPGAEAATLAAVLTAGLGLLYAGMQVWTR